MLDFIILAAQAADIAGLNGRLPPHDSKFSCCQAAPNPKSEPLNPEPRNPTRDDTLSGVDDAGISALRVVRVLRPLRLLSHIKKLQLLLAVMVKSLYDFGVLAIVACFILAIFAILGVNLFAGSLYQCTDHDESLVPVVSSVDCDPLDPALAARGMVCDALARKLLPPRIMHREQCSGTVLTSRGPLAPWKPGHQNSYVAEGDGTEILLPRAWHNE